MLTVLRRSSARSRGTLALRLTFIRGRRLAGLTAAAALAALGSATALGESALRSGLAAAVADTRDYIAERSPGLRTRADMTKGKPRVVEQRTARALPRVREARKPIEAPLPTPAEAIAAPFAAPAEAAAPAFVLPAEGAPGGVVVGDGGGPLLFTPVLGPGIVGGGGGGGIIATTPTPEPTPAPTSPVETTPVPEPAPWAMMILGFAAVGLGVRRSRHGRVSA